MSETADEGDLMGGEVVVYEPPADYIERHRERVLAASRALEQVWRDLADPSPASVEAAARTILQAGVECADLTHALRDGKGRMWRQP